MPDESVCDQRFRTGPDAGLTQLSNSWNAYARCRTNFLQTFRHLLHPGYAALYGNELRWILLIFATPYLDTPILVSFAAT